MSYCKRHLKLHKILQYPYFDLALEILQKIKLLQDLVNLMQKLYAYPNYSQEKVMRADKNYPSKISLTDENNLIFIIFFLLKYSWIFIFCSIC
jgi:hypothetical protein